MTETTADSIDRALAGRIFSSPDTRTTLEILCDDLGSRFAGTASEKEAADFLEARLRADGLEEVHTEKFEYRGWTRGAASLIVTSPWQRELDCLSMPMSPPETVRGRIVDMGYGAPEDFDRRAAELKGNIALVNIAQPVSATRWIHRTEKYNRSVLAGASAFIFMGNEPGYGPVTGALGFDRWGVIPGIMVSRETGLLLRRVSRRHGAVEARIQTRDVQERQRSWNVIGEVKGKGGSGEMLVIGCHYDGHDIAQGAMDPACGLVATLEAARALAARAESLARTLRFVLFGVEELGLIGAHAYVEAHEDELDRTRFMLNLDSAGAAQDKGLILYGPDTTKYFRALAADLGEDLIVDRDTWPYREPEHLSADHYPFMAAGVASGFMRPPEPDLSGGFYHTAHDTVDKVRTLDIQEAAYLAARLAWRVANDDAWSATRSSPEEIARAKREYDRGEARQVEKAVEEMRRQRR